MTVIFLINFPFDNIIKQLGSIIIIALSQHMNDIIMQQIDVVVVGDKQHELISLMLEHQIAKSEAKKKIGHSKYLQFLGKLIGNALTPEPVTTLTGRSPQKFTKIILTDNFWLHIHFFVHDNKIFDPFVSEFCRGNSSICLVAASEKLDIIPAKNYLNQSNTNRPFRGNSSKESNSRKQIVIESQILAETHQISVSSFPAVLALKITQQRRIIEQSSNLRLTVNQISRWIVDRHFQIKQKIKLKESLGDQIENYIPSSKKQFQFCKII